MQHNDAQCYDHQHDNFNNEHNSNHNHDDNNGNHGFCSCPVRRVDVLNELDAACGSPTSMAAFPLGACQGPCGPPTCENEEWWMNELNGTHVFDRFYNTWDCNGAPFREAVNPVDACAGQDSWSSKVVLQTLESYSFDTYGGDSAAGCPSSSRGCAEQALDLCLVTFEGISKPTPATAAILPLRPA